MDFVTGATGIVGMPLVVKLLAKGQTVRALHRPSSNRARVDQAVRDSVPDGLSRFQWVEGDVTDPDSLEVALEGVTRVFHCAALVSFHKADHAAMRAINAEGTANLVNAMLHLGTPRLVHLSSVAALGYPLMVGPSRKRFLGDATGAPVDRRDAATATVCALAWREGARLFRVHDVAATREALTIATAWEGV